MDPNLGIPALSPGERTTLKALASGSQTALIEPHIDKLIAHGLVERTSGALLVTNRGRLALADRAGR